MRQLVDRKTLRRAEEISSKRIAPPVAEVPAGENPPA